MGLVVNLHGDPHRETQLLLAWYVTGQIDTVDRETVEAHLAECEECRSDLALERKLHRLVADLPAEQDLNWLAFRERMGAGKEGAHSKISDWWITRRQIAGWAVAAMLALVTMGLLTVYPPYERAIYRTLGSSAALPAGNVIILFHPNVTEESLRRALGSVDAELVGGPTSSHAYILRVPGDRQAACAILRARPEVVLVEPIDPTANQ